MKPKVTYVVKTIEDWELLVKYILKNYSEQKIFLLHGNLGSGKTTFVQHFGKVLGVKEHITSPTFSIVHEYHTNTDEVYHFDLYRIKHSSELQQIGFEDYLFSDKYCLIEWPDVAQDVLNQYPELKNKLLVVDIQLVESNKREVTLMTPEN